MSTTMRIIGIAFVIAVIGLFVVVGSISKTTADIFNASFVLYTAMGEINHAVADAGSVELAANGAALLARYPHEERRIFARDGRLVVRTSSGERFISPPEAYISNLRFIVQGGRATPSFVVARRIGFFDRLPWARAVTFDADLNVSATGTYKLGVSPGEWQSINQTLYFSTSSNVGVATSSFNPGARLHIISGDLYVDTTNNGLIIRKQSLSCWKIIGSSTTTIETSSIACP